MRKTYFISDLHLQITCPEITQCLVDFLAQQAMDADALYILGDLFEAWTGCDDEYNAPLIHRVTKALRTLSHSGVPCYFMRGNRDFLVNKKFSTATGVKLLRDPTVIDLYGKPTLLMHGDKLCTDDKAYQRFRRLTHNWLFRGLFLTLPQSWRRKLAGNARKKSRQHTQTIDRQIQDVNIDAVVKHYQRYKACQFIHGHTHLPGVHQYRVSKQIVKRYVLAAWEQQGQALMATEDGHIVSLSLPIQAS